MPSWKKQSRPVSVDILKPDIQLTSSQPSRHEPEGMFVRFLQRFTLSLTALSTAVQLRKRGGWTLCTSEKGNKSMKRRLSVKGRMIVYILLFYFSGFAIMCAAVKKGNTVIWVIGVPIYVVILILMYSITCPNCGRKFCGVSIRPFYFVRPFDFPLSRKGCIFSPFRCAFCDFHVTRLFI